MASTSQVANPPKGTTAQRPNDVESGGFRYNTDLDTLELYDQSNTWVSVGGSSTVDNTARTWANTASDRANTVYDFANTISVTSNIAPPFNQANTALITAQGAFSVANNASLNAIGAHLSSNNAAITAQSAFGRANTTLITAQSSFSVANNALITAQGAFSAANGKLSLVGGGTITNGFVHLTSTDGGNPTFRSSGANGTIRGFISYTNNSTRWFMAIGSASLETGANSGSNFDLYRYDDNGAFLSTVFSIARNTGVLTYNPHASIAGINVVPTLASAFATANSALPLSGGTLTGDIVMSQASPSVNLAATSNGTVQIILASHNTGARMIRWLSTDGGSFTERWRITSGTTETGANSGTNLFIYRFPDNSTSANVAFWIRRSDAMVFAPHGIVIEGTDIIPHVAAAYNRANTANATANNAVVRSGDTMSGDLWISSTWPVFGTTDTDTGCDGEMVGNSAGGSFAVRADVNAEGAAPRLIFGVRGIDQAQFANNGLIIGSPTGSWKGLGTINAVGVYDDNTLLTCMAMSDKFINTGVFDDDDIAYWDSLVPDLVVPAIVEKKRVYDEKPSFELRRDNDGSFRKIRSVQKIPRYVATPVYDETGRNGIDMIMEYEYVLEETPEKIIPRRHELARLFKRMIDDGFDPRSPEQYIAKMKADHALPAMPSIESWTQSNLSTGEMFCRLWLATEMLSLAFSSLVERVKALEEKR